MEKLVFDSGIKEYRVNDSGVLRFNPADPNVYERFVDAADKIQAIEAELVEKSKNAEESGVAVIRLMAEADRRTKALLSEVFGPWNDFDQILGGVNLLAVGGNGERVITNLFAALQPILQAGAETCAAKKAGEAAAEARARRARQQGGNA